MIHIDSQLPSLHKYKEVSLDLEIFGAEENKLHRPTTGRFACLSVGLDDGVWIYTDEKQVAPVLDNLDNLVWIFHHAKFDITHLRRWATILPRKRLWDTMLMDQILWGGYYDLFRLNDLARRYLGIKLEKETRSHFEDAQVLDDEMIKYAAKDAEITLAVKRKQREFVTPEDLKIYKEIELPFMWTLLATQGFRIDKDRWLELAVKNKERAEEAAVKLHFNPHSNPQTLSELKKAGFTKLRDTLEKSLRREITLKPDSKAAGLANIVLEARKFRKRSSTYGANIIKSFAENEYDDVWVIHTDWKQRHAETSRMASSDPNMQNIPSRDTNEFRECFIARPGHKVIIADYGQQEPRITAYIANDTKMIKAFERDDIYISLAHDIFQENITRADPRRKIMKSLILGIEYGMSPYGLAERENITKETAEEYINKFLKTYPKTAKYIRAQKRKKNYITTVSGAKIHLNPYSSQCERNAVNSPAQGSAAEMTKLAANEIYAEWPNGYPFGIVNYSHDEIVLDVPEEIAPQIAEMVRRIMIEVAQKMCPGVPFAVDVHIGDSWGSKED